MPSVTFIFRPLFLTGWYVTEALSKPGMAGRVCLCTIGYPLVVEAMWCLLHRGYTWGERLWTLTLRLFTHEESGPLPSVFWEPSCCCRPAHQGHGIPDPWGVTVHVKFSPDSSQHKSLGYPLLPSQQPCVTGKTVWSPLQFPLPWPGSIYHIHRFHICVQLQKVHGKWC